MLAYYQGYTYSQVADTLDASLPATKSGIRAGLLRLHTGLEQTRHSGSIQPAVTTVRQV